jgi:hypothetical protein
LRRETLDFVGKFSYPLVSQARAHDICPVSGRDCKHVESKQL